MRKILCLIFLAVVVMLVSFGCNLPTGPNPPQKSDDIVEFKYVRDLPIIDPSGRDPSNPSMFNEEFGGINLPTWQVVEDGWWVENPVAYSQKPYCISTGDGKVSRGETVAETFYTRVKGTTNWIKLSTVPNGAGKRAVFYINQSGISTPPQTN